MGRCTCMPSQRRHVGTCWHPLVLCSAHTRLRWHCPSTGGRQWAALLHDPVHRLCSPLCKARCRSFAMPKVCPKPAGWSTALFGRMSDKVYAHLCLCRQWWAHGTASADPWTNMACSTAAPLPTSAMQASPSSCCLPPQPPRARQSPPLPCRPPELHRKSKLELRKHAHGRPYTLREGTASPAACSRTWSQD